MHVRVCVCVGGALWTQEALRNAQSPVWFPGHVIYSLSPFLPCLLGTSSRYTLPTIRRILGLPIGNHLEYSLPKGTRWEHL